MLHLTLRSRRQLTAAVASLLLLGTLLAAGAHAATASYEVTGSVLFFDAPEPYIMNDPEPVSGGETFMLTFDVDDALPLTGGNGTTVSSYDAAVTNISLTIDTGDTFDASVEGVLAADNGSNHQWSFFAFESEPGASTTLPTVLSAYNFDTDTDEDFGLTSLNLVLLDLTSSVYGSSPPELVLPDPLDFGSQNLSISWVSFTTGAEIGIVFTINDVTVIPEPGTALLLMLGLGGLASRRR